MEFRFEAGSPVSAAFSVKGTITATFEIGGGGSPEPPEPPVGGGCVITGTPVAIARGAMAPVALVGYATAAPVDVVEGV